MIVQPEDLPPQLGNLATFDKAAHIKLDALWCDQGMAHVVEIYEKSSDALPASIVVIDFGVEVMKKSGVLVEQQAAPAVAYLVNLLKALQQAGRTPTIDLFVVSHQDTDHWGLIPYFVEAIKQDDIPLVVSKLCYGGQFWKPKSSDALKLLRPYVPDPDENFLPYKANVTDYGTPDVGKGELAHFGDVVFRTLIVNAPVSSPTSSLKINGTSAVLVIEFGGYVLVLPGDATWETFKRADEILALWTKGSPLKPCLFLSAPHHGALATISQGGTSKIDVAYFDKFIDYCTPLTVLASAGSNNSFNHPILEVLYVMCKSIGTGQYGSHSFVAFKYEDKTWYNFFNITHDVFTSVLTDSYPVRVADWFFKLTSNNFLYITKNEFDGITKEMLQVQQVSNSETDMNQEDNSGGSSDLLAPAPRARTGRPSPQLRQVPRPFVVPPRRVRATTLRSRP
ncbi:hypothetical protein P7L70_04615 (plasmid) [Tistrella mobilis]|uniref:hypothetical protein n=1 Tax=Tistrella mobilis TaxID=171437 RepID=UPI0035592026